MPVAAGIPTVHCQVIGWGQTVASNYVLFSLMVDKANCAPLFHLEKNFDLAGRHCKKRITTQHYGYQGSGRANKRAEEMLVPSDLRWLRECTVEGPVLHYQMRTPKVLMLIALSQKCHEDSRMK